MIDASGVMASGRASGGRRERRCAILAVLAVGLLVATSLACSKAASAAPVALESNTSVGDDPFTASVTVTEVGNFPASVQAVNASFQQSLPEDPATGTKTTTGTAPGLYGGTQSSSACDAQQMITFLTENPDKAKAWAGVQQIDPATIADYLGGLTPVVLTTDTWVTNHGFQNGSATTRPAVLQAGTAALVDSYGTPRAKCSCGNPLTLPPENTNLDDAPTQGDPWPSYQASAVTTITPAAQPTTELTLTDIQTGTSFEQPTGSASTGSATGAKGAKVQLLPDGLGVLDANGNVTKKILYSDAEGIATALQDALGKPEQAQYLAAPPCGGPHAEQRWPGVFASFFGPDGAPTGARIFLTPSPPPAIVGPGGIAPPDSFAEAQQANPDAVLTSPYPGATPVLFIANGGEVGVVMYSDAVSDTPAALGQATVTNIISPWSPQYLDDC